MKLNELSQPIGSNPAFKSWFGNSKVVDKSGNPLRVYRGDYRGDKIGPAFKVSKANSGRFYFTDDPDIASNYSTGKPDNQHIEDNITYASWFRFPQFRYSRERYVPDAQTVWYRLPQSIKERVKEVALNTSNDDDGNIDFNAGDAINGKSGMEWEAKQAGGNWLKALVSAWLESGTLYGEERKFMSILHQCGLQAEYDDPSEPRSLVTPVYLSIQNPLDTSKIPQNFVDALVELVKKDRSRAQSVGYDQWDKKTITIKDWYDRLKRDLEHGTVHAWTSVPEKVTKLLQSFGYDGIKDRGGKHGGSSHTVWIAFEPNQIKSAIGNKGTFNPSSNKITESEDESKVSKRDITDNQAFQKWFAGSKVIDSNSEPLRVYHGTASDFDEFLPSKAKDLEGRRLEMGAGKNKFYFTNSGYAAGLAAMWAAQSKDRPGSQPNVMPVYLSIKKPISSADWSEQVYHLIEKGKTRDQAIALVDKKVKREGYDGIQCLGGWAAFYPSQVKSAIGNKGTFNPSSNKITESDDETLLEKYDESKMVNWQAMFDELLEVLPVKLPMPQVKIVNRRAENWLGQCTYGGKIPITTSLIELQKSIMFDEYTAKNVIAHELCHYAVNMLYKLPYINTNGVNKFIANSSYLFPAHGQHFQQFADMFNAKYGAGFVTITSDQKDNVADFDKPIHLFMIKFPANPRIYVAHAIQMTDKIRQFLLTIKPELEWKVVLTTNRKFKNTGKMGTKLTAITSPEMTEVANDIWATGKVVFSSDNLGAVEKSKRNLPKRYYIYLEKWATKDPVIRIKSTLKKSTMEFLARYPSKVQCKIVSDTNPTLENLMDLSLSTTNPDVKQMFEHYWEHGKVVWPKKDK